jgi:hypothetical protein
MKDIKVAEDEKRRRLRDKCLLLNHRIIITDGQRRRARVKASKVRVASRRTATR